MIDLAKLRSRRVLRGLTQQQLGDMLGMSRSMVSRIETGDRPLEPDQIVSLCRALECRLEHIIEDTLIDALIGRR
jgi:transcriptional regulator with XRE-family HTH domain